MNGSNYEGYDDLFIGQTEMGHIGPEVSCPIFLVCVKRHRYDPASGQAWFVFKSRTDGDFRFRASDAMLDYDHAYTEFSGRAKAIALVSVNLLTQPEPGRSARCYWSIKELYDERTDALSNIGPVIKGDRQPLAHVIDEWATDLLIRRELDKVTAVPPETHDLGGESGTA